jgi:CheY-like chemotaxis protein
MSSIRIPDPFDETERRPRVLVVEDEVMIRSMLADSLRDAGCDVVEAASADEALSILKASESPHVVVTDVRMPGESDGLSLAAAVRETWPWLKVIVTSGNAPADGSAAVADLFFPKPYELFRVAAAVRELTDAR